MPDSRVAAIVLTHNRRDLLVECLRALLSQSVPVQRIHVVDNASSDGTEDHLRAIGLLDESRIDYERLERNVGGAGGFSHGVDAARRADVDWLWLMDDDAEPRPDCLERMLSSAAAGDEETVALCSRVEGADGTLQALHRGFLTRGRPRALPAAEYREEAPAVGYATFVGLLVRAGVARALDPPVGEFFLWADDYEYSVRLGRHGQIRLIPASVIVHKDARRPFLTRRARLVNRLLGWEHASTRYDAAWRNFFGLRNYVWMLREHERLSPLGAAGVFAQFVAKAVLYDERPLARIPWLARYAWRGWKGDFDNSIAEQWPPPRRWNRASVR